MEMVNEKEKINNYLKSTKSWPIIVDLQTKEDLLSIKEYFEVGDNRFLSAKKFCEEDGIFKLEEFYDCLTKNEGNTFVIGLSTFLKLNGEDYTRKVFKELVSKNINGHVVILTYQCKNFLKFTDPRISESGRFMISNVEPDVCTKICFISPDLSNAFTDSYKGLANVSDALEVCSNEIAYVETAVKKEIFPNSMFHIYQMNNGYDILCDRDSRTNMVPRDYGKSSQWNYALTVMGQDGDWSTIVEVEFGSSYHLAESISSYNSYSDIKKWLYYIALSIFGVHDNEYLQMSIQKADDYAGLIKSVFRTILTVDKDNTDFRRLYQQRKNLICMLKELTSEIVDYCKIISVKEKDYIFYLTDSSQQEKEKIISWLDKYGIEFSITELRNILGVVYPDLASYLSDYRFRNELLDGYFEKYKYQKLINAMLPEFEDIVTEQSHSLGFMDALKPRTSIIDKIDLQGAHAYFLDAMGVEYLGFIQDKCNQYNLDVKITCARCELPSLTCYNKEFVKSFQEKGCQIADIKDLDEIKHHGKDDFSYETVKTPIYLLNELEIIDTLLKKIQINIFNGTYKKEIIISDHGASRLAVLHNTENIWSMETSGKHSGRCCPKNEINTKPDFAIEKEDFWVLANYDRFKGSRKANFEVHGGATLEEVAVPIIEIMQKQDLIEAFIMEDSKLFTLGAKEYPTIRIYVGTKSNNVSIKIDNDYYDAFETAENIYTIELENYTKKGKYSFDIQIGSSTIAVDQQFEIKKKGMSENSLFD